MSIVEIDGSTGEGGGQILRYSLSLSALTLKPVRIYNIRAKRTNPGLRPQHLTAVKALATITDAYVEGDKVGSMEIYFEPRKRRPGNYRFNIGTAGSISLVLQAVLPTLLFSNGFSRLEIIGGTDVSWSPPIDYMRLVFVYNLKLFGVSIDIKIIRRGHYPRGGGRVIIDIEPVRDKLRSIDLVKALGIKYIRGISHAVRLPSHVAIRQARSAEEYIREKIGVAPEIEIETYPPNKDPHLGPGSGIVLYAETKCGSRIGSDSLGEKGKPAEKVGREAAEKLVSELSTGMAFDKHMGDMLIPYMFLADGISRAGVSNITLHTLTAIEVARKFISEARVKINNYSSGSGIIVIGGIGFSP